jgi:hypothetical protein
MSPPIQVILVRAAFVVAHGRGPLTVYRARVRMEAMKKISNTAIGHYHEFGTAAKQSISLYN